MAASTSSTQAVAPRVKTPASSSSRRDSSEALLAPASRTLLLAVSGSATSWPGSDSGGPSGSQNGGRVLVNSAPGRYLWKTWLEGMI